jgi:hypothetical protein
MIDAFDAHDGHPSPKATPAPRSSRAACGDRWRAKASRWRTSTGANCSRPLIWVRDRNPCRHHAACNRRPITIARARGIALGCAAVTARLLALPATKIREALGIAEYFGPRGQMLRTCDSPSMVKDGTGWGAHVGVSAALLARDGFTGAPAITLEAPMQSGCG